MGVEQRGSAASLRILERQDHANSTDRRRNQT
jgi:hypothetical protein